MSNRSYSLLILLLATPLWAEKPLVNNRKVPAYSEFVRTIDVEGAYGWVGQYDTGSQYLRLESRYLDREVNAFVGLITTFSRFNEKLHFGEPGADNATSSLFIANWGADIGIVRGKHLWAIDLMGCSLGSRLAFGPAFVGEHEIGKRWMLFHRTAIDFFVGDTIVDSDQGLLWKVSGSVGLTAGYRIFAAKHINRNGPRIGILWRFQNPKIPFIFPSLG